MKVAAVWMLVALLNTIKAAEEPKCSPFDYEEKTMEKMIRTEIKCEAILNDVNRIKEDVQEELKTIKEDTSTMLQNVQKALNDMAKEKEKMQNEIQTAIAGLKPTLVSFKAKMENNVGVNKGNSLIFHDVISNHGDGYDAAAGVFRAPIAGVYLFTMQLCVTYRQNLVVETVVDGKTTSHVLMYDENRNTCYDHTNLISLAAHSSVSFRSGSTSTSTVTIMVDSTTRTNFVAGILVIKQ